MRSVRRQPSRTPPRPPRVPEPFTDRGQWALKLLLAPHLPAEAIGFPRTTHASANALARAASVSVSTAANVVRYLRERGHLVETAGALDVRRLPELLRLWKQRTPPPAVSCAADFRLPTRDPEVRVRGALLDLRGTRETAAQAFAPQPGPGLQVKQPRACLATLSACRALGTAVVEGAAPALYVDDMSPEVVRALGLRLVEGVGAVSLHVPRFPESVFRAAVDQDGVPCTDVLQCWLDMRAGVPRHAEQARALEEGPLSRIFHGDHR